jgi:hypothetical protein
MAVAADDFAAWLDQADIPPQSRTAELHALLQAVFRFRQQQGSDYYSTRLLSHFLLHADTGLKVAQVARLLGIARPTASGQQNLSSKQAIQQAHHRLAGRSHGKLLPRFAGPIAAFLVGHPHASRAELLDFIKQTFGVQVSRIALYKFLKKYGLQAVQQPAQPAAQANPCVDTAPLTVPQSSSATAATSTLAPAPQQIQPEPAALPAPATAQAPLALPAPVLVPVLPPPPPFCSDGRNTLGPSCFSATPSTG